MSSDIEKKIVKWIRLEKFSLLTFLEKEWSSSENTSYIGFYYFVQCLKNENKNHIFSEIVTRQGSESNAYLYLGKIADRIYSLNDKNHVAIDYFRKSIEIDSDNSEAHWHIFHYTRNYNALINSINVDYHKNDIKLITGKINSIFYLNVNAFRSISKEDKILLKNILMDIKPSYTRDSILVLIHYFLEELELGVGLIEQTENVFVEVIQLYLNDKLINYEKAFTKVYSINKDRLVCSDNNLIYETLLAESKKGQPNPTPAKLIYWAYSSNKFKEVVEHFESAKRSNDLSITLQDKIYYLLAQIKLGQKIDQEINEYVQKFCSGRASSQNEPTNTLYLILEFKKICQELEKNIEYMEEDDVGFPIDEYATFQNAQKILNNPEILKNDKVYDELKNQLFALKKKSDTRQNNKKFLEMNNNLKMDSISEYEFLEYCNLGIEFDKYDKVIKSVKKFHEIYAPTMITYNILGVCYSKQEKNDQALKFFKESLECMRNSKEQNPAIISNYLSSLKKISPETALEDEYQSLQKEYNFSLMNIFKWDYSLSSHIVTLFKYSPFNINTIDALANQYFYLPSKKQLNDPIELPELDKMQGDSLIYEDYKICSFSNNENSMLMWSHYAQQHQGIMIEYWFGGELPKGYGISKIQYADDIKRNKEKNEYLFNQFLLTKNKDWEYEKEVRLFTFLEQKVYFDTYRYPNPDRSKINAKILTITLGLNFPNDKKKLLGGLVNTINNKRMSHEPRIKVQQAFLSEGNNFSLEYREIDLLSSF